MSPVVSISFRWESRSIIVEPMIEKIVDTNIRTTDETPDIVLKTPLLWNFLMPGDHNVHLRQKDPEYKCHRKFAGKIKNTFDGRAKYYLFLIDRIVSLEYNPKTKSMQISIAYQIHKLIPNPFKKSIITYQFRSVRRSMLRAVTLPRTAATGSFHSRRGWPLAADATSWAPRERWTSEVEVFFDFKDYWFD